MSVVDGELKLSIIPASHVDYAWRDGASCLQEACETSGGEITGDQLKYILARGERLLVRMERQGKPVGWSVARVDQLPNIRVLFVTDLVAHGSSFEEFFSCVKDMALQLGCSRVRCAAKPAQSRLYRMKLGFEPVYEILERVV